MIKSEIEYETSKASAKQFERALDELDDMAELDSLAKVRRRAIQSLHSELNAQISEYEHLVGISMEKKISNFGVKVFCSYCHSNESSRQAMEKHFAVLKNNQQIKLWSDRQIVAGQKWSEKIRKELDDSDIVVFLISSEFLNSEACIDEWYYAKQLEKTKSTRIIPIILSECAWNDFDTMGEYQALPEKGKPIAKWDDKDSAWVDIYRGIKVVIEDIRTTFTLKNEFKNHLSEIEF